MKATTKPVTLMTATSLFAAMITLMTAYIFTSLMGQTEAMYISGML